MTLTPLTALSPLDGRYGGKVEALRAHFSEFGLIRNRVRVEVAWLKALAAETQVELDEVAAAFSASDGEAIKAIEARTNHDVKAMEYWLKERLSDNAEVMAVADGQEALEAIKPDELSPREALEALYRLKRIADE